MAASPSPSSSSSEAVRPPHVKVRFLGRGAFGTAVLYRRDEDSALVVVKEFDLTFTAERVRAQVESLDIPLKISLKIPL